MTQSTTDIHVDTIHFLNRMNTDLREVVALAETDFIHVNAVLRNLYEYNQSLPTGANRTEIQSRLDTIMVGLQYMDVLSQRVDHLVITHQKMSSVLDFRKWFFHLHVFQSRAIKLDLLQSIAAIRESLKELKSLVTDCISGSVFSNTSRIETSLQNTITSLANAGGEVTVLPTPPLTDEHLTILSSLYTMDKERVVLNWFQRAMPTGRWEDLLLHFEEDAQANDADNIELF